MITFLFWILWASKTCKEFPKKRPSCLGMQFLFQVLEYSPGRPLVPLLTPLDYKQKLRAGPPVLLRPSNLDGKARTRPGLVARFFSDGETLASRFEDTIWELNKGSHPFGLWIELGLLPNLQMSHTFGKSVDGQFRATVVQSTVW